MAYKKRGIAIIVMSDEHSGLAMSAAGHPWIQTPHLDRFAENSTRFSSAYTNSPICIPARAAFATGRYTHDSRNWDNALPYTGTPASWAHILRDAGHDVTSIGKLHFRNERDDTGFSRQIMPMHVVDGIGDLLGSIRDPLPVRHKSRAMAEEVGVGESSYTRYDRSIAEASINWIREHAHEDGWVLFSSFVSPHFPLIAPEEFCNKYDIGKIPLPKLSRIDDRQDHPWVTALRNCFTHDRYFDDGRRREALRSYGALCSFMDDHFGRICKTIDECGLADDALVIYTSDHGDNMGARGLWGKSTLYEEAVRVPMLMRAPGEASRSVVKTHVSLVDIAPTVLAWMGQDIPQDLPGRSLLSLARQDDDNNRGVFSEYHAAGAETGAYMLRRDRWKLIYYVGMAPQLFDLSADPDEMIDLVPAGGHREVVDLLTAELRNIVDPEAVDAVAKSEQRALIELHGGRDVVIARGGFGATPAPGTKPRFA